MSCASSSCGLAARPDSPPAMFSCWRGFGKREFAARPAGCPSARFVAALCRRADCRYSRRMNTLLVLDYTGVAVFAVTGALAASRKQLDLIGFLFLASVTGIGGGTLRDVVLGVTPVFWITNPVYIPVCAAMALLVYFTAHLIESRYRLLLWFDAAGLAAYSVMGAAKGLAATGSATVALVTGVLTATFGGILRDLLSGEPSVLLRPEVYVTAALAGAAAYTGADMAGTPPAFAAALAIAAAFLVRGGALAFGWTFPRYRSRAGRSEEELKRDGIVRSE